MIELLIKADTGDPRGSGERELDGRWPIKSVRVRGEVPKHHGFSDSRVIDGFARGYIYFEGMRTHITEGYDRNPVITGDVLVLHEIPDGRKLRFRVLESPGRYAFDDEPGYRVTHEYACELED